jgi:hypothetical protein
MSATRDSTLADTQQLIADLQRQLVECRAERDEALEHQTPITEVPGVIDSSPVRAGRRSLPPPRWGRAGVGVTGRLEVGVMPRTDPW